ncbi:MAG: preprotein translocase subunit SecE [Bryobacteraceae bacterium]|nr:preprotein translocase subunit SecE [Bryobacteraceae bacterium]MDW8379384.1 preprotein translocase subunit SecE [Bryobacterales bacterium]
MQGETSIETVSLGRRISSWPQRVKDYYEDLKAEMRRVTWPSWKQVRATTTVVIISVFAFSAYFFVVDLLITRLITKIFDTFAK